MQNYEFLKNGVEIFKPFRPSSSSMSKETMQLYAEAEINKSEFTISEGNIQYFHNLAKLCKEKGTKLYVVMAPMYDVYIDSINYSSRADKIAELAQEEEVLYLDCNTYYDRIGLNSQDFEDAYNAAIHLNDSGAEKVTRFILEELYEKK